MEWGSVNNKRTFREIKSVVIEQTDLDKDYRLILQYLKEKIRLARLRASVVVNAQ